MKYRTVCEACGIVPEEFRIQCGVNLFCLEECYNEHKENERIHKEAQRQIKDLILEHSDGAE